MWLDGLKDLVGTLKKRIEQHGDELSKKETATRYALIDPLLTAMGWDLSDPEQVKTDFAPDGTGDCTSYTMFTGEEEKKIRLVIEAKKLSTQIDDKVVIQAFNYCVAEGIPYFAMTNGNVWALYRRRTQGKAFEKLEDKRIVDFKLTDPDRTTVMNMLWLWRGNFESEPPTTSAVQEGPVPPEVPALVQPVVAEVTPSVSGTPLHEFNPGKMDPPPAALHFPDGTEKRINFWNQLQISVVEWLVDTGFLTEDKCPILGKGGGYFVATTPYKRNGRRFRSEEQIGSVWIDLSRRNKINQVSIAQTILNASGVDPAAVRVVV